MALLRVKRYRIFVFGAAVILFLLYRLSQNAQLNATTQKIIYKGYSPPAEPASAGSNGGANAGAAAPAALDVNDIKQADKALHTSHDVKGAPSLPTTKNAAGQSSPLPTDASAMAADPVPALVDESSGAKGVHRVNPPAALQETYIPAAAEKSAPTSTIIHWQKLPEHYPVPEESVIPLPTGSPKLIPRIQHRFEDETIAQREVRESRLAAVRREMQHAWSGYRKFAWTHDELVPVAKTFRDPFCGWAASIVDALDTLWIMGMRKEFDEAYEAVKTIDFTTTPYRAEIPVFETTIRYLGGLLAAYDVSGGAEGNYPALLTKATELAEILMGVFDTPNRMPVLYYNWKPAFVSQPAIASRNTGIAEMGSLTMEFTRLAQLTGNNRYYDAIARIVNALEEWQSRPGGTALPGIFPEHVDASGCNRSAAALQKARLSNEQLASDLAKVQIEAAAAAAAAAGKGSIEPIGYQPSQKSDANSTIATDPVKAADPDLELRVSPSSLPGKPPAADEFVNVYHKKRTVSEDPAVPPVLAPRTPPPASASYPIKADGSQADYECIPMNLTASGYGRDTFGMGGSQDSTYEYFPKQYLLLGGLVDKYKTMHERVSDAVVKYLLYRPMIPDSDRAILFSSQVATKDGSDQDLAHHYELTHLTCFLGGMFAMGGRIFDRPDDVRIGGMLADGCVWAYEAMPRGIMPEVATMLACENVTDCAWNETRWHDGLDHIRETRDSKMRQYKIKLQQWEVEKNEVRRKQEERIAQKKEQRAAASTPESSTSSLRKRDPRPPPAEAPEAGWDRAAAGKQLQQAADESSRVFAPGTGARNRQKVNFSGVDASTGSTGSTGTADADKDLVTPPMPRKPESHEEFVNGRIARERLKPGFLTITDRRYILRPEAIESVWYMYRITGDPQWQAKGWQMFEAVVNATRTEIAHSAIKDVTQEAADREPGEGDGPAYDKMDNMESFWLSETLKYFYLLFTLPDVISLDEYVLNTEAHPFKRPV